MVYSFSLSSLSNGPTKASVISCSMRNFTIFYFIFVNHMLVRISWVLAETVTYVSIQPESEKFRGLALEVLIISFKDHNIVHISENPHVCEITYYVLLVQ